jgi:hypothetical protein
LFGLQRGSYRIFVAPTITSGILGKFFPGVSDASKAEMIQVGAGDEIHLGSITLDRLKAPAVRLHFKDADGPIPSNRTISYVGLNVSGGIDIQAPATERDQIVIPQMRPGHYRAIISWDGANRESAYGFAEFDVGNSDLDVNVEIYRDNPMVTGNIVDSNGDKVVGREIQCSLRSVASPTLASNCFGFKVVPGNYRLLLRGVPDDAYVSSITANGADVLSGNIRIDKDTQLNVFLSTSGGTISGSVVDTMGKELSSAIVALLPDKPLRDSEVLIRSSESDWKGRFELQGIAPGAYHIFAWTELNGAAYRNAEFMKQFEDRGTPVQIEKGQSLEFNVTGFQAGL